ncbi:MAG: UvrD-helicase domain-containing protein [Fusobacteriaceae bacterium]|jgi:DNA helicase-2/ATP-dependent DNA helicase PcrA|nr:UvrD-helicase domain-containing protein [Fusobacteriaceae bacterium]
MQNNILDKLNDRQREACLRTDGPLLILAGAGSGKTRTITYRIAHMIRNCGISPYAILAVTFTNKAAREMKERVADLVGDDANRALISTFHSFGLRLLRVYGTKLGYGANFTIYDTDDQKRVIKGILKELRSANKVLTDGILASMISRIKEEGTSPEDYNAASANFDENERLIGDVYLRYNKILKENNAMDFSDILVNTEKLLRQEDVLRRVRDKFRYIMVDEYQDTNRIQYDIIQKIAAQYRNLCVVGDENQSIYGFRGANIQNILDFERDWPDAVVVKLEENYRSTSVILDAANNVIRNNASAKDKTLWTKKTSGELITLFDCPDGRDEVNRVLAEVEKGRARGMRYRDFTVLYRTNAQSRLFEEGCLRNNIPYKVFGGTQFYQRAEIKDLLAYLSVVNNPADNANLQRIINIPRRKIGDKTVEKLNEARSARGLSLYEAVGACDDIAGIPAGAREKLKELRGILQELAQMNEDSAVSEIFERLLSAIRYREYLTETYDDAETRAENVEELFNSIRELERMAETLTLREYLENISLVSATDDLSEEKDYVKLMTIHNSKGLEFPVVFLCGLEEEIFPGKKAVFSTSDLEEERRLCYVAITRAEDKLYLSFARMRYLYGELSYRTESRFLAEIPESLLMVEAPKEETREGLAGEGRPAEKTKKPEPYAFEFRKTITVADLNKTVADFPYKIGEKVMHKKFGLGVVRNITPRKVEIDFVDGRKEIALVVADKFLQKQ